MSVTECHTRGVWMRPILQLFAICPIVMLASPFFFQNPHGMMITIVSSPLSIALSQTCLVDVSTLSTRRQVSTRRQGPVYPASFALSELELILTSLTLYHDMLVVSSACRLHPLQGLFSTGYFWRYFPITVSMTWFSPLHRLLVPISDSQQPHLLFYNING